MLVMWHWLEHEANNQEPPNGMKLMLQATRQETHQESTAASMMATTLTNICWCCTGSMVKLIYCTGVQMTASAPTIAKNCDRYVAGSSCRAWSHVSRW